jgi:hypothetical protein
MVLTPVERLINASGQLVDVHILAPARYQLFVQRENDSAVVIRVGFKFDNVKAVSAFVEILCGYSVSHLTHSFTD